MVQHHPKNCGVVNGHPKISTSNNVLNTVEYAVEANTCVSTRVVKEANSGVWRCGSVNGI